ncbi:hypothetical protein, conserved [Trypanosoma brucei gambiense DAL972]|uniref:Uncharacterized protein n=1 Tax=Trypanosoma brucei gambiense (strain MHOM/CI/86/DAL972) TaxID=679716 RepID=C9ZZ79_TRYB9|nr:hypothetical protein, conserved [Trypanosoma brucei gambiense DAL972]CBH14728.1 hypothetical protein, conserved [Trypanosoma brucei gambiense DAL972]|eukprot:XP_011776994.1 hypothetical protein, conserved [Trypanosoma brucei gambiense DAL972]
MNFVPLYRSILKGIHTAKRHPYHLQDIRFILSYPLVKPVYYATKPNSELKQLEPLQGIDTPLLVRTCLEDLRRAFMSVPSKDMSVAQQFVYMRELGWLKCRLENIASESTDAILKEARVVASEVTDDDFLDDQIIVRQGRPNNKELQCVQTGNNGSEMGDCGYGVASAGAIGLRYEMFILQNVAPLPLVKEFLSSFSQNTEAAAAAATSNQKLQEFARRYVPRTVMCQNEDLTLTVTVNAFDAALTRKSTEENNPFARVHRYFMIRFDLSPSDPLVLGVDVVNSYFLRLDAGSAELVEDIGYLHAADVWKLSQELRVKGSGSSTDSDDIKDNGCVDGSGSSKEHAAEGNVNCMDHNEHEHNPTSHFELSFINPSDGPTIMKGQLYYTLRTKSSASASKMNVGVISFGHILLFNDE